MKNEIKVEFYRATHNRWLWIALLLGMTIAGVHFIFCIVPLYKSVYGYTYPLSVFGKWLGGENTSVYPVLYYFIMPILSAIPFAGTLKEDIQTGYIQNIVTRVKKEYYYIAKFFVTFLIAGAIAIIPLVFNFMLTAMVLPAIIPQANTAFFPIFSYSMLGDLFYSQPYTYVLVYMGLDFVFFGLLSTVGLLAAYICNSVFTTVLAPFFIYLFVYAFSQITGWNELCPFAFLRPSQPIAANPVIIFIECVCLLIAGGIYFYVGKKKDII